ncbi:MAG: phosphate/phosphite/phosphonate ABC transporter substrate-binding protein [Gammaproteobacteria bacterium]|nr:phosphate/phosphite/phosphonate ABC transporter substrate-binding protein [Gammaproteobacteria bacterium]
MNRPHRQKTLFFLAYRRLILPAAIVMLFGSCATGSASRHQDTIPGKNPLDATDPITMVVPPMGKNEADSALRFQALADYLEARTGYRYRVRTSHNFLFHWTSVRVASSREIAIDAAHFSDYRLTKLGNRLLAKETGSSSLALITRSTDNTPLHKFAGKPVAVRDIPSLDATRLHAMLPDPARQPRIYPISDYQDGLELLDQDKVAALMLPTSLASDLLEISQGYRILAITEPVAARAITASRDLDPVIFRQVQRALLFAADSSAGRFALEQAGLNQLIAGDASDYDGYRELLASYWGY